MFLEFNLPKKTASRLRGSGFDKLFKVILKNKKPRKIKYCRPIMDALLSSFDPEDNTFNLGQTKIHFGLEDVFMITGLPIDGEAVTEPEIITSKECEDLIGITPNNSHFINHEDLINIINNIDDNSTDEEVEQSCRAAALLGISGMIMQQSGHSMVHSKYLSLLKDVDNIKSYAWGAASWANLIYCLRKSQTNIGGCTLALMIFALLRMPGLVEICYKGHKVVHAVNSFRLRPKWIEKLAGRATFDNKNKPTVAAIIDFMREQKEEHITLRPYCDVIVPPKYESQTAIARSITNVIIKEEQLPERVLGFPVEEPIEVEHHNLDDGITPERVQDVPMEEPVEVEHQNLDD
ncbi:serine/threonine-protein phosphatase 7 long form-like protein, partial [Trifolium medium]|nr:serine/threonine-protein phosphatase 7 long form-like protein [Trifolium medium]